MIIDDEKEIETVEQNEEMTDNEATEAEDKSFAKNPLAHIANVAGLISIGTDLLATFGGVHLFAQFDAMSLILELTAIGTGIAALALKQNKRIASNGILLGVIGIVIRLLFPLIF